MRAVTIASVVVVVAVVGLWAAQRRLVYFPVGPVPDPPADVEPIAFMTSDGLELGGWFLAADDPAGTVIVFNGNAGNRAGRLPLGGGLVERGFSALMVDYRGYGPNPGSPTEDGLALDARAALQHVRSRADVDPERIVYFGESLGAGVAVGLAAEEPPAALVLRSPFESLAAIAALHYPFVPEAFLRDRFANDETIGTVTAPLLIVAGTDDRIVPAEQSRAVFDAAAEPKRFVTIDGAGHNDPALSSGPQMLDAVTRFLAEHLGRR